MINNIAYIGIGSNIGVQINFIDNAVELIDSDSHCEVESVSSIYESAPYGSIQQDEFFNAVVKIRTNYEPKKLFRVLKEIENQVGRNKTTRWGPREIDLDILFYNDLIYTDNEITIPHKDLLNRDFVLIPLNEIAPDLVHPGLCRKISDISNLTEKKFILRKIPHRVLVK
jgi:2-amino-4-hydroxy-6-hydroxymethyldihydropteridine diphosphokinase